MKGKFIIRRSVFILLIVLSIKPFVSGFNNIVLAFKQNKYYIYTVKSGDNVWDIANTYKGNQKLDNVISRIQYINDVQEIIYPGQQLLLPIKK